MADEFGFWHPGKHNPAGLTELELEVLAEAINIIRYQWYDSTLELLKEKAVTLDRASMKIGTLEGK